MPTKYPPALSLSQALPVIKAMYGEHGRETSIDLMPKILDISPQSSYLPRQVSALQSFGLVDRRENDILELTDLAMAIVDPIGEGESVEAKFKAFNKIDFLADLLMKYKNGKLPSPEQLKSILNKSYGIARETVDSWYKFVFDSFRALPFDKNDSREESSPGSDSSVQNKKDLESLLKNPKVYQFSIPLEDGSIISVSIPRNAKDKDLKVLKLMIDAINSTEN